MNFVVAFKGEAQPIIHFYQLEKVEHSPYPIFCNDQHSLILSGLGRDHAVSATTALHQVTKKDNLGWMNLGIAGHGNLTLGEAFLSGKIVDDISDKSFYPPQIYQHSLKISTLQTCSQPSSNYDQDLGFDMEAHAFYKTASKFSIRELVQVIKIVSDNPTHKHDQINPSEVPEMIYGHLKGIDALVKQIDEASTTMQPDLELDQICKRLEGMHSFSVTRVHQLHDLLRHAKAMGLKLSQIEELIISATDAGDAIKKAAHFVEPHRTLP
jgi:adenosylhomocysteine nucleosidase